MSWLLILIGVAIILYGTHNNNLSITMVGAGVLFVNVVIDMIQASQECEGKDYGKEEKDDL